MQKEVVIFVLPILFIGFFIIKNKFIGSLFIFLGYFMGVSDYICNKLLRTNIDLFTLLRIDGDMLTMSPYVLKSLFLKILILTLAVVLLILIKLELLSWKRIIRYVKKCIYILKRLLNYMSNFMNKLKKNYTASIIVTIIILIAVFNFTSTGKSWCKIAQDLSNYIKYSQMSVSDLLQNLGANDKYIFEKEIKAEHGKNIIIIYCESLENGYFDNNLFPNLMPKINELIANDEVIYYKNYENCIGSGWTIGALYTTQTGLPCFFGTNGNTIFSRIKDSKLLSYAKVLESAGYNNIFLSSSNLNFAGTGNMMKILGYDVKNFDQFDIPYSKTGWGVHDKDLFEQAKIEYDKLSKIHKPFNLTLLTVDTHFTKGVPDERLSNIVSKQFTMDTIEYSVNSLDYLIYDFYQYVKSQSNSDNTEIVILGDHPLMGTEGNTPAVKRLKKSPRNITLISSKKSNLYDINDKLRYYDIPYFILDIADVKSNAVFSKKLFLDMSPEKIEKENALFTNLNLKLTN